MKKIVVLGLVGVIFLSTAVLAFAAQDINLKAEVKLENPEGPTYYVYFTFKYLSGFNSIKVLQDGREIPGITAKRFPEGSPNRDLMLASVAYPPSGSHQYKVSVYDASNGFLGEGTAAATVPAGSYQPPTSGASGPAISAPFFEENVGENVGLIKHLNRGITWAYGIGTLLAVFMILFGAFSYITSGGNQQGLQNAKDMIVGALIGLALLLLLYLLLPALGVDIKLIPTPPPDTVRIINDAMV